MARRRAVEHWMCAGGFAAALAVTALAFVTMPDFLAVYRTFDLELPLATRVLVAIHSWLWLFPLLVLAAWWRWPRQWADRGTFTLTLGACGALALFFWGQWAAYLPLQRMAEMGAVAP